MASKVRLLTIHPHVSRPHGMVLVMERDGKQFVLRVEEYSPTFAAWAKGRVTVHHKHSGYGSYGLFIHAQNLEKNDLRLDPICDAVLNKGWNTKEIKMTLHLGGQREPFPRTYSFPFNELSVREKYTGSRTRYCIAETKRYAQMEYDPNFCWAIIVDYRKSEVEYRATEFSLSINVSVPQIYDKPKSLAALLRAIKSLPHAKEMKNIHPAQLAPKPAVPDPKPFHSEAFVHASAVALKQRQEIREALLRDR